MGSALDDCIQFTRHAGDVLFNFNRLRSRNILTDVTVRVGGRDFHAHKTVLMACSGFFYTIFINAHKSDTALVSLDSKADADGFAILLDFMYTSCLTLKEHLIVATLNTAIYLQMEHMVETCKRFMESRGLSVKQPQKEPFTGFAHFSQDMTADLRGLGSPVVHYAVSTSTSNPTSIYTHTLPARPFPIGSASNAKSLFWKIPKESHAINRSMCSSMGENRGERLGANLVTGLDQSAEAEISSHVINPHSPLKSDCQPNSPAESSGCGRDTASSPKVCNWKKYKFIVLNSSEKDENSLLNYNRSVEKCSETQRSQTPVSMSMSSNGNSTRTKTAESDNLTCSEWNKLENDSEKHKCLHQTKPYDCDILQTSLTSNHNLTKHKSNHSGEKPYRCNVCAAQFNRPANLKTHLRIHSGEKPYKCETCGSAFVQCEICELHFRHKSQLRLHLKQKHDAMSSVKTNNH
ncbi:B-cell CLL/lymphoma 6 member B protein [Bagarius yarrelli]|uniref:B-cell CLL/lymphoma 6 member B protein n=1 Tax=Bagarius yarrelli TaxID=175774 RepID=A0A556TZT7_BAGYA|nr:B-cell CLL/lymphoma 6 member B protein [Bagarius yarrelli]